MKLVKLIAGAALLGAMVATTLSADDSGMKCGAGKCGASQKKEKNMKCGAGKCGASEKKAAKCGASEKKAKSMKCGAGKCGSK